VGVPERIEGVTTGVGRGKHVHDDDNQGQNDARQTCNKNMTR
jgi:hypothetical protein